MGIFSDTNVATAEISKIKEFSEIRKSMSFWEKLSHFLTMTTFAIEVSWKEKEVMVYGLFRALLILFGILLYLEIFSWMPVMEIDWDHPAAKNDPLAYLAQLLPVVFISILIAFPFGIFTSATIIVHHLHFRSQESTFGGSLKLALQSADEMWALTSLEAIYFMKHKFFCRKNESTATRLLKELLRLAWLTLTFGMYPSLAVGNSMSRAIKQSVIIAKEVTFDVIMTITAYSVGKSILGLILLILYVLLALLLPTEYQTARGMGILVLSFFPVFIVLTKVFLAPVYLISMSEIYHSFAESVGKPQAIEEKGSYINIYAFISWLIYVLLFVFVMIYRDELGITEFMKLEHLPRRIQP